MNKIFFKFILSSLIFIFAFHQKFLIFALKCRMEDEPSDDELRKIIHTCVKKVIGNNESIGTNFYHNAYEYNNSGGGGGGSGGGGGGTNRNNNGNPSWMNSHNNKNNNDGTDGHEDYDRIRNREHLQMRPFINNDNKKLLRLKLNILSRRHFTNNNIANNNQNRHPQSQQQHQHQQHQLQSNHDNINNNNNNDNYYQRYNNMGMDYDDNIGNSQMQQYDMNMGNGRDNNNKNNNNNMYHDFNNNNSNDYGNNGQNEQNNHNNNNNNNNGNWNYYQNKTNKFNTKQQDKQKQHDGACIVHCFFGELKMLNNDEYPDKRKVIQILTKDIKNNDLREFYTESVKECFHLIEAESKHRDKCEFAKTLINCMTDYAKINCEDWDDKTIIF